MFGLFTLLVTRSQDTPAKRNKTATATTSTAISVPVVEVVAGGLRHPSRCSDDRSSNVKPPLSVPVVEVPVVEVVAGVEQKTAGDDRDRLGDRDQEQDEFSFLVEFGRHTKTEYTQNNKFPQHYLEEVCAKSGARRVTSIRARRPR